MSTVRSIRLCGWILTFLGIYLQLSISLAQTNDDDSTNVSEETEGKELYYDDYDFDNSTTDYDISHSARKPFRKPSDIFLCHNLRGCECNGKHDRANCSCIVNGVKHRHQIVVDQMVKIPPNLREISIHDCPYVEISQTNLAYFPIKSLIISQVNHLRIAPGTLKAVDKLTIKQIGKLEYSDAFEQLEANTVTFSHVTFPVGAKFHPVSIGSQLDILASNLTNVTIIVDSLAPNRTISLQTCVLDRLNLKINTATFVLNGNRFARMPHTTSELMDIAFSLSLQLKNNQFGTTSNGSSLPNVMSSDQSFVFESKEATLSVESKRWLEHFKFEFTGPTVRGTRDLRTTCERRKTTDSASYEAVCPNVNSYMQFPEHKSTVVQGTHQPQKERQVQTTDRPSSKGTVPKHTLALSLLSLFIFIFPFFPHQL